MSNLSKTLSRLSSKCTAEHLAIQCPSPGINLRCKFSSSSNLHLLFDGLSVTMMQSSLSLQSAIIQSPSLSLFTTMKIETEQILVCIDDFRCLRFWSKKYIWALRGRPNHQSSHYQDKHLIRTLSERHSLLLWSIMLDFCCAFGCSNKRKTGEKQSPEVFCKKRCS